MQWLWNQQKNSSFVDTLDTYMNGPGAGIKQTATTGQQWSQGRTDEGGYTLKPGDAHGLRKDLPGDVKLASFLSRRVKVPWLISELMHQHMLSSYVHHCPSPMHKKQASD